MTVLSSDTVAVACIYSFYSSLSFAELFGVFFPFFKKLHSLFGQGSLRDTKLGQECLSVSEHSMRTHTHLTLMEKVPRTQCFSPWAFTPISLFIELGSEC